MTKQERKKYQKEWHSENREYRIMSQLKRQAETKLWFHDLKKTFSCKTCPESDPACLDFHHVDSKTKDFDLADCYTGGYCRGRILAEIAKCEVL